MAYRFSPSESFEAGFRRITKEQIAKAHKYLAFNDDHARSIHESRKSLKRLRALLRLFRPSLGKSDFSHENARYRDIGRMLSTSRDRQVMLEVIDTFLNKPDVDITKRPKSKKYHNAMSQVRSLLTQSILDPELGAAGARTDMAAKRRSIAMLDDAQHELGVLHLKGSGFATVSRGLRREYFRGVKTFVQASSARDDEVFHDWRKCVQLHWRHMSLLQEAWPEYFQFRATFAKDLSDVLGHHNDLGLVTNFVRRQTSDVIDPKAVRKVCKHLSKQQKLLRAQALGMGSKLFADEPDEFVMQIERYWQAARQLESGRHSGTPGDARKTASARKLSAARLFKLPNIQ